MKKSLGGTIALMMLLAASAMFAGCLDGGKDDVLNKVFVTILPQAQMVEAIAGEGIEVDVLIPAGQSPHSYSLTPGQLKDLSEADIFFMVGSGVEFEITNLDIIRETNRDIVVVDLSSGVELKAWDEHHGAGHDHEEVPTRAAEEDDHDHEGNDPHIWLSPRNMIVMAENVRNALISYDPDNRDEYTANHASYMADLNTTISKMEELLQGHEDGEFLAYHPAWGYFGDDFDLVQISIEDAGKQPGPQGIAAVIDQAKEHNITVVFVEPQFDTSSANQIADEIGGRVVVVDPLARDYLSNMVKVATEMAAGFH